MLISKPEFIDVFEHGGVNELCTTSVCLFCNERFHDVFVSMDMITTNKVPFMFFCHKLDSIRNLRVDIIKFLTEMKG